MIELIFMAGSEIVKFRVKEKKIFFSSKNTNYSWVEWNPLNISADKLSYLRKKKGEEWFKIYQEAEKRYENFESEEEICKDLIEDFKNKGMKIVRKE